MNAMLSIEEIAPVPTLTKRLISLMEWRDANKEHLAVMRRQSYYSHKRDTKAYKLMYYEAQKKKYCDKHRNCYVEHNDAISESQAEQFKCECGGKFTRSNKLLHERMNMHTRSLAIYEIYNAHSIMTYK